MNTTALYVCMYFKVDKELTKTGWQVGFGPQAAC